MSDLTREVEVTNLDPGPMVEALRRLATLLETGNASYLDGGMLIDYREDNVITVKSDLRVFCRVKP